MKVKRSNMNVAISEELHRRLLAAKQVSGRSISHILAEGVRKELAHIETIHGVKIEVREASNQEV